MYSTWLATGFALLAVAWTVLPLLRDEAWWIRALDFPRVQLFFGTVLATLLFAGTAGLNGWGNAALLAVLIACLGYQGLCIAPYTAIWPSQLKPAPGPDPGNTISLFSANVLTPNRNSAGLLSIVRAADPDVIVLIETDAWWEAQLRELEQDYRHTVRHPRDNLYGMHLYSRLELADAQVRFLVEEDKPSIHARVVLRSGKVINLHCLHPAPPAPTENESSLERDVELIIAAREIRRCRLPAVVIGDLNDVAWSATSKLFQKISGLLDPRIGRGLYNTFHAKYPLIRWPLDHVFCSRDFALVSLRRLGDFGSDHFPIQAVLQLSPAMAATHEEPIAGEQDHALADDKFDRHDAEN